MANRLVWFGFIMLNATFNNSSVISWWGNNDLENIHMKLKIE
jgi:hypothetical protein